MDIADLSRVACSIRNEREVGTLRNSEERFLEKVRLRIATDGYVINLSSRDTRNFQTFFNSYRREPSPVLDATEPLFLKCNDQPSIFDENCGDIAVICVDSEDVHVVEDSLMWSFVRFEELPVEHT